MKKILGLIFLFCVLAVPLCADDFTEIIQDLAVQIACTGTYSSTQAGGGWYDDPFDYYRPQMMAQRFANMSGNKTRTETFYGVCFDYAQYAYDDITAYKKLYNDCGMRGDQYFIAHAGNTSNNRNTNQITLGRPTTRENATVISNGIPEKRYEPRNVKTHKLGSDGVRATQHAWLWIQRDDGVWFWIDPTWTDNVGYVVWGYVANGEEIQLKPDEKFCINYPAYLNNLPDPPARGPAIQSSPSTQVAQGSSSSRSSSSYSRSYSGGYNYVISVGFSKPLNELMEGNYIGASFWDTFSGVSVSFEDGNAYSIIGVLQLDYYNLDTKSLIFDFGLGKQLGSILALYAGAGIGFGTMADSITDATLDNIHLAWKAFGGVRLTFGRLAIRADVSYVRDSGVIAAAYAGWQF